MISSSTQPATKLPWLQLIGMAAFLNAARLFWNDSPSVLLNSFDTGWIVRTGELIMQHGVPMRDSFSWTSSGHAFTAYQWLYELICGLLYSAGGLWLVGLTSCFCSGLLFFLVLPRIWMQKGIPALVPYLTLSLVLSPHWFNVRPQVCSYFLLLAFIAVLELFRLGKNTKSIWLLPPLMVLWVNIHLFWSVGLLLICTYCVCDVIRRCKPGEQRASVLIPVLAASLAATVINPYGLHLSAYLLTFLNHSQYMGMNEVQPGITMQAAGFSLAYLAIAWRVMYSARKSMPAEAWIVLIFSTVAALAVRRYGSLSVILTWPYFGAALGQLNWQQHFPMRTGEYFPCFVDSSARPRQLLKLVPLVSAVGVLSAAIWCLRVPSESAARDMYCDRSTEMIKLVENCMKHEGRLFNDPATGDWLLLLSKQAVFIDTRYDMYPKLLCEDAFACMFGAPGALHYLDTWGVTNILVRDDFKPFNDILNNSTDWMLIADDGGLSFWGRSKADDIKKLTEANLGDAQLSTSNLSSRLLHATRIRRAEKYYVMAKAEAKTQPAAEIQLLEKAEFLLPTSIMLRDAMSDAKRLPEPSVKIHA